jgi:hypothetical protein
MNQMFSYESDSCDSQLQDRNMVHEISGSHSGEYEDDCLLGCCVM